MDRRSGFTLIELLVALAVGGLVAGSVLQILTGQARFVEMQTAREEVQQNGRAALELIGSELRGLPGGAGLVRAARDSVTFQSPRNWGVVCAVNAEGSLEVTFPAITDVSHVINLGTAVVVNVGTPAEPEWTAPARVVNIGGPMPDCGGEVLGPGAERRTLTLGSLPEAWSPEIGNVVYVHDRITYRIGSSSGLPGVWIQRRIGDGPGTSNQPFAGPVAADGSGLRFEYLSDGSSPAMPTPVGAGAQFATIDRIAVIVSAVSRHPRSDIVQTRTDTILVPLRGRPWTGS